MSKLHIGLIDSGCDNLLCNGAFIEVLENSYKEKPLRIDTLNHGTSISDIIGEEDSIFTCAQVFNDTLITTAQTIAYAIEYLCEQGVDLIHMSLGLANDRKILKNAVEKALEKNITIIASAPTLSSNIVYPASYKGVIAVTADARCKDEEHSYINASHAIFGAPAFSSNPNVRGSSCAAAFITKKIAQLHNRGIKNQKEQINILKEEASFKTAQFKLNKRL